jgi:hypothetical protein
MSAELDVAQLAVAAAGGLLAGGWWARANERQRQLREAMLAKADLIQTKAGALAGRLSPYADRDSLTLCRPEPLANRSGLAPAGAELARCPLEVNGPIEKLPPPYGSDLGAGGKQGVRLLGKRERVSIRIGDLHVTDSVRVGLDRFVLDPLGGEAFEPVRRARRRRK